MLSVLLDLQSLFKLTVLRLLSSLIESEAGIFCSLAAVVCITALKHQCWCNNINSGHVGDRKYEIILRQI
jgi:hypothetical protein